MRHPRVVDKRLPRACRSQEPVRAGSSARHCVYHSLLCENRRLADACTEPESGRRAMLGAPIIIRRRARRRRGASAGEPTHGLVCGTPRRAASWRRRTARAGSTRPNSEARRHTWPCAATARGPKTSDAPGESARRALTHDTCRASSGGRKGWGWGGQLSARPGAHGSARGPSPCPPQSPRRRADLNHRRLAAAVGADDERQRRGECDHLRTAGP